MSAEPISEADASGLARIARSLLDCASPHMTHRNAREREAYKQLRALLDRLASPAPAVEAVAVAGRRVGFLDPSRPLFAEPASVADASAEQPTFQARVAPWMAECFGAAIASDVRERGDRFLEEALELLQSHGYDRDRVATLCDYVYGRPVGEPAQEVGGVMVTLAAYCLATGLDMHAAGDAELARINVPAIIEKIRVKQASKCGLHTPLPTPPASAERADADRRDAEHEQFVWRVVANAGRLSSTRRPRWAHVADATGFGYTKSAELCRRAGFDHDELVGPAIDAALGRGEVG